MSGAPLLLLHGALGSAATLEPLAARLRDRFDVHTIDLEGHGAAAPRGRPFRVEHFAENAAEAIEGRWPSGASIFGYSMGGYVALHLAATRPGLARAVATLGTKLRWSPEVAEREGALLDPERIRAKVPRFAETLAARHAAAGWESVLAGTRDLMRALGAHPLLDADALRAIAQPVRLTLGDRDATVSLDETAEAYRALPAGELEVLPGTPHPLEKAPVERLAASLSELFGRVGG